MLKNVPSLTERLKNMKNLQSSKFAEGRATLPKISVQMNTSFYSGDNNFDRKLYYQPRFAKRRRTTDHQMHTHDHFEG